MVTMLNQLTRSIALLDAKMESGFGQATTNHEALTREVHQLSGRVGQTEDIVRGRLHHANSDDELVTDDDDLYGQPTYDEA